MNILIKLMSIVSLVIAPTLASVHGTGGHVSTKKEKQSVTKIVTQETKLDAFQVAFISQLKNDGIITKNAQNIEVKDGVLLIDGNEITDEKYRLQINQISNFTHKAVL